MYGIEGAPAVQDGSAYEDVDARTIQWLQAGLAKRKERDGSGDEAAAEPSGLHPELIR